MGALIERLLNRYEAGGLTRRQLVQGLTALGLGTAGGAARAQPSPSTFRAVGLNHIALYVTDIPRARDFYVRHLGLEVTSESAGTTTPASLGQSVHQTQQVELVGSHARGMV